MLDDPLASSFRLVETISCVLAGAYRYHPWNSIIISSSADSTCPLKLPNLLWDYRVGELGILFCTDHDRIRIRCQFSLWFVMELTVMAGFKIPIVYIML